MEIPSDPVELAYYLLKYAKDWAMTLQFLDAFFYNERGFQLDTTKIEQIIRHELREE
jgi:hypothetical protein